MSWKCIDRDVNNNDILPQRRWLSYWPIILRHNLFWVPKLWIWQPIWTMMPTKWRIHLNWGKLRIQNDSNIFKYILYTFQNFQPDHLDIILQMLHHFRHWWLTISSEQREVPWEDCNRRPGKAGWILTPWRTAEDAMPTTNTIDVCRSSALIQTCHLWIYESILYNTLQY